ncbi:MAG: sulfite exporter TauE/SafE family protein [Candidatus Harrisonbacteria bacterium CG10_big_fil_rev_8_21_14_0_10_40_38]|uniref:Probable membrane transporter protein n=1 Tax=Candidatus Harrisonbacteria bacterium CG10_big_fil_rev_8_21_14_0_10_40_38 TaxID=1974583 RepID=A0A2H0URU4_9BACT|nr:MAG: sulfite exporter TauE/SafE family protein [Candidatus Harrisonbacteria bacterium CG10_big_fil_rev_8_21_14_0_10_40_38]
MTFYFLLSAFFAEVIGTIAGFGSSTILLPFALIYFNFPLALTLVAIFHVFGGITRIGFFRHGLDWKIVFVFGLPSVIMSYVGASFVSSVSQEMLKVILGIFLVFWSVWSLFSNKKYHPTNTASVIGGSVSGFLAGLIGTGGALRGAFLNGYNLSKSRYITTAAAIGIGVDMIRIPAYLSQGFLSSEYYPLIIFLFFVAFIGVAVAKKLVDRIPKNIFSRIILLALFVIGTVFAYSWIV